MIKNLSTIGNIGSVVDITGVTADYDLKIGETALRAYSSVATIPLYIKTNGGIFEFYLGGDSFLAASSDTVCTWQPNNGNVSGMLRQETAQASSSTTSFSVNNTGYTDVTMVMGLGRIVTIKGTINTYTSNKNMVASVMSLNPSSVKYVHELKFKWEDTTPWTTLGTINLAFAQSGRIIIKRLA